MAIEDVSHRSLADLFSLAGRSAVVTGGARGIGRSVATRMLELGAAVAIADIREELAGEVAKELCSDGGRAISIRADVRSDKDVERLVDAVTSELGGIDIVVNCAGVFPAGSVESTSSASFLDVYDVNVAGMFRCSRAAAAVMRRQGRGGVIVNFASTRSFRACTPFMAPYIASKHAVSGLTQALALELAPDHIRVVGVAPGTVDTPGVAESAAEFAAAGLGGMPSQLATTVPLGRMLVPDDVARVVVFLASDLAAMVSGSVVLVEGGRLTL